jgi:hypothetical protein
VGSNAAAVRAALGPPICLANDGAGNSIIVYGTIWFRTVQNTVTRAAIRTHLGPDNFKTGTLHC